MRRVAIGGVVVLVLLASGYAGWRYFDPVIRTDTTRISELRASMEGAIRVSGPDRAYRAFKKAYGSAGFSDGHNAAHLFGESLYAVAKEKGLHACDQSFNFGCYHGYMKRAISTEGLEVISRLDEACKVTAIPTVCQHGIGHGILEYLGHEELLPALAACGRTERLDPIAGCTSGVFMEYNVPMVANADGRASVAARPFDVAKPYDPCPTLAEEYRAGCYFSLPQWWKSASTYMPGQIAGACAAVTNADERNACLNGFGTIIAPEADFDVARVRLICATAENADARSRCLAAAAGALFMEAGDRAGAEILCTEAGDGYQNFCGLTSP